MVLRTDLTDDTPAGSSLHAGQHNEVNERIAALDAKFSIPRGVEADYTFVAGDVAGAASWYGGSTFMHVLGTWTPTRSGKVLLAGLDDFGSPVGSFELAAWVGTVPNVDYPDGTDDGTFNIAEAFFLQNGSPLEMTISSDAGNFPPGTTFTLVAISWDGAAGDVLRWSSAKFAMWMLGGIPGDPPPYDGPLTIATIGGEVYLDRALPPGKGFGEGSFVTNVTVHASEYHSSAEGTATAATGQASHAEGDHSIASGSTSHAEGGNANATGDYSHAEGANTIASGSASHAEGYNTTASGVNSHAEGEFTVASGMLSHAQGNSSVAEGFTSHAEGNLAHARYQNEHAHSGGSNTGALGDSQFVRSVGPGLTWTGTGLLSVLYLPVLVNQAMMIRGMAVVRNTGTNDFVGWTFQAVVRKAADGTIPVIVGKVVTKVGASAGASTWSADLIAVADQIQLQVGGGASSNHCSFVLERVEVL